MITAGQGACTKKFFNPINIASKKLFIASKIKNNEYKLKKVFVSELEKFNGESMVEFKGKVNIGSQVVVEGIKGISESDIVRIN